MRSTRCLAVLFLVIGCTGAAPQLDPTRFEADIRAIEAADRATPPPQGGIVFVGSSSIKNWTDVAADFPGLPVLNRGFGGSTLPDAVYYADRIVFPYHPRLVVLYAGDNDLTLGRTPAQLLDDYRAFVSRVRSAEPATRLAFVSIKPSAEPTWSRPAKPTGASRRKSRTIACRPTSTSSPLCWVPPASLGPSCSWQIACT